MNQRRNEKFHPDGQYTDHLSMGRAFLEWYPKFTPNIIDMKMVGNNKLWPDMQKESWNIHLTKILICSHTLNGTDS
jgi:hypothetical protein